MTTIRGAGAFVGVGVALSTVDVDVRDRTLAESDCDAVAGVSLGAGPHRLQTQPPTRPGSDGRDGLRVGARAAMPLR